MYDHILVPTDGSPAADAAVDHAIELATQFDATLHALYVVDATAYTSLEAGTDIVSDALEREGERAVASITDAAEAARVPAVTSVVTGTAFRSILSYADDNDVDLIVMGTHGRRGLDRYLLGSVTERVVRVANQPVMTIRYDPDKTSDDETDDGTADA